ncbi:MAG TPA: tetratricopeptide repeat protein [Methylocella sp.]|nr:tetratricopeptide repeat protein [Methylocella sp.]
MTTDTDVHRAIRLLEAGESAQALACLREFKAESETNTIRCSLVGLIYLSTGQNRPALEWFDRALLLDPANSEVLSNRGLALQQLGRAADALAAYEEAARNGCTKPTLFYHRGNLLRAAGRLKEAIESYDMALRLDPACPETLRAGALVLSDLRRFESALEFIEEALRLRPSFVEALIDRGNLLYCLERHSEALASYDDALAKEPGRADILNNRGSALLLLGRLQEAGADFDEALRIAPAVPEAWLNRGNLFLKLQEPEAALAAFDKAITLRPRYVEALCGRAVALKYLERLDEALDAFDTALACDPASAHVNNNKGALLLLCGDFERGLELYEYRWNASRRLIHALAHPTPEWNGEDLGGRSIAVFDELGFGDAIQFARYLPILARRGARVSFFCRRRLHRLFEGLGTQIKFSDEVDAKECFDYQIALSSLPRAVKTRLATIPAPLSYLSAERPLAQKWAARLGSHGFKIGICWRGNQNVNADPARSIPLSCFAKLARIDDVRLISIQELGSDTDAASLPCLITLGENFDSGPDAFIDTAAIMQNLDLIVTCDTSIAHLAGALGRPVFVLLKQVPDWRWLLDREDSPWYPSMRLFRQKQRGNWDEVFDRVVQALLDAPAMTRAVNHSSTARD